MKKQAFDFDFKLKSGPLVDKVTGLELALDGPMIYRVPGHPPFNGMKGVHPGEFGRFHGASHESFAPGESGFKISWISALDFSAPAFEILCEEYNSQSGAGYQLYQSYGVIDGNGYQKVKLVLQADDTTQVLPEFWFPHKRDGLSHEYELIVDRDPLVQLATLEIDGVPSLGAQYNDLSSLAGKNISSPHMSVCAQNNGSYNINGAVYKLEKMIF